MTEPDQTLDRARRDAGLSHEDLWFRYFALGGMRTAFELEALLYGALTLTSRDQDLIAVALNERFSELGANQPIPYTDGDSQPEPGSPHSPISPTNNSEDVMPSSTRSNTQERPQTDVRANGHQSKSEQRAPRASKQQTRQATARFNDAITQLIPAWVNASNASAPAAYCDPRQALGFAFDIQQQMLTLQRKFWDQWLNVSQNNLQGRTIHQDPDELGFYVEND